MLLPEDGSGRRARRLSRRRTCWTTPISPPRKWCWERNRPAGRGADTLPGAKRLFMPMRTGRGAVGVVGIDSDRAGSDADAGSAAAAGCVGRSGRAGDRAGQAGRGRRERALVAETERLRSALLTSISHDLRTPLASILGSATSLRATRARRADAARTDRAPSRTRPNGSIVSSATCST